MVDTFSKHVDHGVLFTWERQTGFRFFFVAGPIAEEVKFDIIIVITLKGIDHV